MHSAKHGRDKKHVSKKDKKLRKLINNNSDGDDDDSEHELSYYLNDRVKMMKEVLKIIKPRKIRSMAPSCMRNMDNEEINSMLLEELLGISNVRLKAIFNGQPLNEDSSSTDEEEQQPIDVISLDDITDDDFVIDLDSETEKNNAKRNHRKHKRKIKEEPKAKRVKKEKHDKSDKVIDDGIMDQNSQQHLMSVLELLELQARARAIRSQLALEGNKKIQERTQEIIKEDVEDDDIEDAIIVEEAGESEIIISSSDSERDEPNVKDNGKIESRNHDDNSNNDQTVSYPINQEKNSSDFPPNNCNTEPDAVIKPVNENNCTDDVNNEVKVPENQNSITNTEACSSDIPLDIPLPDNSSSEQTSTAETPARKTCRHKHKGKSNTKETDSKRTKGRRKHKHKRKNDNEKSQFDEPSSKSTVQTEGSLENPLEEVEQSQKETEDKSKEPESHLSTNSDDTSTDNPSNSNNFIDNDGDGIVLNVDQTEMECILLD